MAAEDVTLLLDAVRRGEPDAARRLIDAVHGELRHMARDKMLAERAGHTLQPTALVNEAYLRLIRNEGEIEDRAHFFGAAARAMERVLVDHARTKRSQKRGGEAQLISLHDIHIESRVGDFDVFEVHEAIETLEREAPEMASLVRFRYFVGFTLEQIAEIEGVSLATVKRRWTFARAWLFDRLEG